MIHLMAIDVQYKFQSTYLYKVRRDIIVNPITQTVVSIHVPI